MNVQAKSWEQALRAKCAATLDRDPNILLETDGGPVGAEADLIFARLIGFEDEIVDDTVRLDRVADTLLQAVPQPVTCVEASEYPALPRTARYVLQSGFARTALAGEHARHFGIDVGPPTFTASVLFVRYKRRS